MMPSCQYVDWYMKKMLICIQYQLTYEEIILFIELNRRLLHSKGTGG